ncbi:MAG: hypothetical protein IT319_21675 [Anaerolineae bacterium]|nr:hypothetical protein [Anaerolineae bacterium]
MFRRFRSERGRASFAVISVAGFGAALVLMVTLVQVSHPAIVNLTPLRTGQTERCLTCHQGIEPISSSHSTAEFGCVSCHGGDGVAVDETTAHTGMIRNPASADNAQQYCGECHAGQVLMVDRSIMTTYAGAIGLIRRAFGLQPDSEAEYAARAVAELKAFVPAETDPPAVHDFAANCLTCHTSAEPLQAEYHYRSTGCSTCHVLYADDGLYAGGDPAISKTEPGHSQTHTFTTAIPYTQCNHCHNRGNYDLRTMTFIPRADLPADPPLTGEAQRLHDYYQPIGQFTRCEYELDCIDCHTQQEVMGDGVLYNNRAEAQYTQCRTCHGTVDELPPERVVESSEELAMTLANVNPLVDLQVGDTILITERGEPLYHIRRVNGAWVLTGKATGEQYMIPMVQGSACTQDVSRQDSASCHECHAIDREAVMNELLAATAP